MRDWADARLDARGVAQEGSVQPGPIRAAWQDQLEGDRNMQYQLWSVLMFQAWNDEQRAARVLPPRREMAATSTGI